MPTQRSDGKSLSTTDSASWQRLKAICADALELGAGEREAFVDERCGENAELRQGVLDLLAAHERAEPGFLHEPPGRRLAAADSSQVGRRFGAWEVVRELGAGGMGVVYQPFAAATIRRARGMAYKGLGLYEEALVLLREAVRLSQLARPDSREPALNMLELAGVHYVKGDYDESIDLRRQATEILRSLPGQPDEELIRTLYRGATDSSRWRQASWPVRGGQ